MKYCKLVFTVISIACVAPVITVYGNTFSKTRHIDGNITNIFNIRDFGATGDGIQLDTDAINNTIIACSDAGGGTVLVPQGNYLSGTIILKSNINFHLESGASIIGTHDLSRYAAFQPGPEDRKRPINIRVRDTTVWFRALILIDNQEHVSITGNGLVDGNTVLDKQGEEGHRGPHGILIGKSKHITISGIRISRSGNYNILGLDIAHAAFTDLTITEGSDGIHIRRGEDLKIANCKFFTSDDAIAGGYWQNMLIADCIINSSCNGIRLILPATDLTIRHCEIFGPGIYGHRRGSLQNPLTTASLNAIILQPGAWGLGGGRLDNIHIHDIRIRDLNTALTMVLNEGNQSRNVLVERIHATGINKIASSVEAWPDSSRYEDVTFRDVDISYRLGDNMAMADSGISRPKTESRSLPYWGWYVRNVDHITFERVTLEFDHAETRPVMGLHSVQHITFDGFHYPKTGATPQIVGSEETFMHFVASDTAKHDNWTYLLDKDLSQWEMYQSYRFDENYNGRAPKDRQNNDIAPIGYNKNVASVFTVADSSDGPVLRISGEIYGCVFTKRDFENYHLRMQVKWGTQKWPPRLDEPLDSGLLYHGVGEAGADYWRSWMLGHEFQIMEGGFGDYWCIAQSGAYIKMADPKSRKDVGVYDPQGTLTKMGYGSGRTGFVQHRRDAENATGQWNTVELICFGDKSVHIVNGQVVMAISSSFYHDGGALKQLTKGKIQLQSEAAEVFYKDIAIKPIDKMPDLYTSYF